MILGVISGIASMEEEQCKVARKTSRVYFPMLLLALVAAGSYSVYRAFIADHAYFQVVLHKGQRNWNAMRAAAERSIGWGVSDYRVFFLKAQACLEMGDYVGALEANER